MAARKAQRKSPRRKAVESEEVERDLTDEGNEEELRSLDDEGNQEELKEDAPFEPKHSAMEAAKAHANLKAIKDYFGEGGEGDLSKMDHPGMQEGLKALVEDGGPIDKAMQHVKDLIGEHHADLGDADEALEKMYKSMGEPDEYDDKSVEPFEPDAPTTEMKDDSFEQGEANLVDSGVTPETELEPLDYDEEEEEDEEKQHGSDEDTEEILERYQHPKTGQWFTRVVGKAWRAKNGRIYVKTFGDADESKDLTDPGNPAELTAPTDTGAIVKDEHLDAIGKAADHLDAMGAGYSASPETHKEHADALREVHASLSDMGNPQELKDDPEGAAGDGDLTEGVEELKDLDEEEKAPRGSFLVQLGANGPWLTQGGTTTRDQGMAGSWPSRSAAMQAAMDAKMQNRVYDYPQAKGLKDLDEEENDAREKAAKALADMNALNTELARKARMYGVNGSRN